MTTPKLGAQGSPMQSRNGQVGRPEAGSPYVAPKGRRRPGLLVLGTLAAALGALSGLWVLSAAADRTSVLRVARDVPYGTEIVADDVAIVFLSVDSAVETVPSSDVDVVVGKIATTNLIAGSLLAPGEVSSGGPLSAGEVLVPLPMAAERMPAGGLVAGDQILIVDTPPPDADPPATPPSTSQVTVIRVGPADLNGVSVVDVAADETDGPAIAARAATGRFALVVQPPTSGPVGVDS